MPRLCCNLLLGSRVFRVPNPSINLYENPAGHIHHEAVQGKAFVTILKPNDELLILIPDPSSITDTGEAELLDASAHKALVGVPPHSTFGVKHGEGLKVIQRRQYTSARAGELIHTCTSGAAFLLVKRSTASGAPLYSVMSQLRAIISSRNVLPPTFTPWTYLGLRENILPGQTGDSGYNTTLLWPFLTQVTCTR